MARVPEVAREKTLLARGIHCCPIFSLPNSLYYEYMYIYEGVEIIYYHHYYLMMVRVNYLLYKTEAVRTYWLPKQAS
jgi:hypothetical protein